MTTMPRKLRSASQLSLEDWSLFFQAWFWLLVFDLGLRTRPFPKLQTYAAQLSPRPTPSPDGTDNLLRKLRLAVDHARYNHLYPMTCLRRSLALQKMLANRGIPVELKIGVRKGDGQLNGHAWLEYQGETIGEPEKITEKFNALQKNAHL